MIGAGATPPTLSLQLDQQSRLRQQTKTQRDPKRAFPARQSPLGGCRQVESSGCHSERHGVTPAQGGLTDRDSINGHHRITQAADRQATIRTSLNLSVSGPYSRRGQHPTVGGIPTNGQNSVAPSVGRRARGSELEHPEMVPINAEGFQSDLPSEMCRSWFSTVSRPRTWIGRSTWN